MEKYLCKILRIDNKIMKKHSSKKRMKSKTGFRTSSVFIVTKDKENKFSKTKTRNKKQ